MKKQPPIKARITPIFRNSPEPLRYFYHPDHLGSTSWVTDSAKNGIQYCEYLPYGEPFLDQRSTTWNSRYTFSGKERDGETGYSYFGARYYNSDISIWLSVDPLSDKYPNLTPYAYCANNPIILVDPDGRGHYVDENGVTIGSDGNFDENVFIVSEDGDKAKIITNGAVGKSTEASELNSPMKLPGSEVRQEMYNTLLVKDFDNPNAENGGLYGKDGSDRNPDVSQWKDGLRWAEQGPTGIPCVDKELTIDYNTADRGWFSTEGTFHGHPSGIGDCGRAWKQVLSDEDRDNAVKNYNSGLARGTNIAFGMGNDKVILYNGKGHEVTISLNVFLNAR